MDATADKVPPLQDGEDGAGSPDDNAAIVKAAKRLYDAAYQRDEHNIIEGYDDLEVRAGNQWPEAIEQERKRENRPCETVNQMGQFVRQVTGDMRQMKPAIKVVPADDAATDDGAEAMSDVIRYIENRSDAPAVYSQGADSQVACGSGAWRIITEYAGETTFNQEIRVVPIEDALGVMWDEDSVLPTREDAMECLVPIEMAKAKFEKLYPDASASDFSTQEPSTVDRRWQVGEDKVCVGEYWWKERTTKTLALLQDGTVEDVTGADDEQLEALAVTALKIEERPAFKLRRALVTASEVIEGPTDWPGSLIPIVPVVGEEIHIKDRTVRHGVIRFAKPVQRMYNYAVSADLEVTALQPKSPFVGTEKNFKKYQAEWKNANRKNYAYLPYTPDGDNGGIAPQRSQPPVSSQGIAAAIERATREMYAVTGIYPASLGSRSNETSGRAIMARDRQGDTGTFVYPDNWARAIRHTGKILADLIPKIYDTARVLRIVGEDGKVEKVLINQPQGHDASGKLKLFRDVTSGAYDVSIQVGPSYATKREEAREGMTNFMQAAPQAAPLIGDLYAKAQEWPLAEEIGERLELLLPAPVRKAKAEKEGKPLPADLAPPEVPPEQAAALQMEMAAKAAETRGKEADARKKEADAQRAEIELERTMMMAAGGQPDVGTALEGMARAILDLQSMIGGITRPQPTPSPDAMAGMVQQPDEQLPPGGFLAAEPQGDQPQF